MRVRAYRFRAYSSKTTARVLKTQLEVACKLYNALLHAEKEEYERNRHSMSKNELRQLALDLRKKNPEFQLLYSQVAQQVAERFYQARERFFDGLVNKPKKKKPHRYLSLVYPQSGWRLCDVREIGLGKNKKRKARLYLSKIGFFTLILHREFLESQVSQVCVKLYPSGRIHVIFLVEEPESQELSSKEPVEAVGVDLGITRLATLSDGRILENPRPLERSLEGIRVLQRTLSRKRFLSKNWLKARMKLAKEHEHLKDFRRDLFFKLGALLAQEYDVLVLEHLNVKGLIQNGTKKRRLRLYDSSFSELRAVLEWQFRKRGKLVLPVPSYNTSRECFLCGGINKGLTLEDRVFHCAHCGFTLDRDLNASLVLLKRAGWVPPAVPGKLRPIPPLPSLGLVRGRQGGVMIQEAPPFRAG
ncbi:hypothetical protein B9Q11_01730 [Candidatus Marsarchaeota G2 archaeon ECH_B_SAG-F08]|uniref:Transposase n=1 Tax=Candidatus Marsarchaeota G2 archaeon ECH_B_SAG-F08 TaxID=1978165 RepID=A0A2R6BJI7_9ARCH|nr:MAG: hypothetical protein B9Q11_01730 [Candidatus Marsarchaeota G2 archaeon ECH_B_SAG-F08]